MSEPATRINNNANAEELRELHGSKHNKSHNSMEEEEFKIPPDLKECEDFMRATSVGRVSEKGKNGKKCKYSLMPIENDPYPLCCGTEEFSELGPGYPIFFYIIKFLIVILLVLAIPAGYLSYFNYGGNDCNMELKREEEGHGHGGEGHGHGGEGHGHGGEGHGHGGGGHHEWSTSLNNWYGYNGKVDFSKSSSKRGFSASTGITSQIKKHAKEKGGSGHNLSKEEFVVLYCKLRVPIFKNKNCDLFFSHKCQDVKNRGNNNCKHIIMELVGDAETHKKCDKNIFNKLSAANWSDLENDQDSDSTILTSFKEKIDNIIIIAILTVMIIMMNYYNRLKCQQYDTNVLSIEDFSVIVKGLPHGNDLDGEFAIKDQVVQAIEATGVKVADISFVYDAEDYIKARDEHEELIIESKKHDWKKGLRVNDWDDGLRVTGGDHNANMVGQLATIETGHYDKLKHLAEEMKLYEEEFEAGYTRFMAGKAFVSFETVDQAETFLAERGEHSYFKRCCQIGDAKHYKGPFDFKIENKTFKLSAEDANEPNDIQWENQNVSLFERVMIWLVSLICQILLVVVGFIFISMVELGCHQLEHKLEHREHKGIIIEIILKVFFVLEGTVVVILDEFLEWIMAKTAKYTRPRTETERHRNIIVTLWKLMFLNNAIIPLMYSMSRYKFFDKDGLIENMNSVFIATIISTPLIKIFLDWENVLKNCEIRDVKRFIRTKKGRSYTQVEALEVFEKHEFPISKLSSYVTKCFMVACFYLPMIPLSVFYAMGFLTAFFWGSKYVLINRSNKLIKYSDKISRELIPEFRYAILLFVLGLYLEKFIINFVNLKKFELDAYLIGYLVYAILFQFVDLNWITEPFMPTLHEKYGHLKYKDAKKMHVYDYNYANPATNKKAKEKLVHELGSLLAHAVEHAAKKKANVSDLKTN